MKESEKQLFDQLLINQKQHEQNLAPGRSQQNERDQFKDRRSAKVHREGGGSPQRRLDMAVADDADDEDGDMSDYIDENFEPDETDEYWGVTQRVARPLDAHINDLNHVSQKAEHLKHDARLKFEAGYVYVDPTMNEKLQ